MDIARQALVILDETFDCPSESWAYFTNGDGKSSYFSTLDSLDYRQALQPHAGSCIAALTKHVTFVIEVAVATISNSAAAPGATRWEQSWKLDELDSHEWDRMRVQLRRQYSELRQAIHYAPIDSDQALVDIIGLIAHLAYHLGALRCKLPSVTSRPNFVG